MIFEDRLESIEQKAREIERDFDNFRKLQTQLQLDAIDMNENKQQIRQRLGALRAELDGYLASEYGIDRTNISKKEAYNEKLAQWQQSHQPFHWWVEFYGIMKEGGFDVIIGNPPYVEYKDIKKTYTVRNFETLSCGDLYAYVVERIYQLITMNTLIGVIVPISIFGTDGFAPLQDLSIKTLDSIWLSCFANRPGQLFYGAQKRLTILLGKKGATKKPTLYTTAYLRWTREERDSLFIARIQYSKRLSCFQVFQASLEKLGSDLEVSAFSHLLSINDHLDAGSNDARKHCVYYTRKFGYFFAFLDFVPRIIDLRTSILRLPSELKILYFCSTMSVRVVIAALSSTTFFWFWNVLSDCRNLNRRDLLAFPLNPEHLSDEVKIKLSKLGEKYLETLQTTSRMMLKGGLQIETFDYASCKSIIDEIDRVLGKHYGFTDEELDFIINYDIKYRMGRDNGDESEE